MAIDESKSSTSDSSAGTPSPARKTGIGELMVRDGVVKPEHVEEALSYQKEKGGKLAEVLIDLGYLDIDTFSGFLARQPGVPSIDLSNCRMRPEVCSLVPRDFALAHEVFPIDKMGSLLTVGMACPLDSETLSELESLTGLRVSALLCNPQDIRNAVHDYYDGGILAKEGNKKAGQSEGRNVGKPVRSIDPIDSAAKLGHVARFVQLIDSLPTLEETVVRLEDTLKASTISMKDVAEAVSYDPAVTARLLNMSNSAMYGLSKLVDHVGTAVTLLGLEETWRVVRSMQTMNLEGRKEHFDHLSFWEESKFRAIAAKKIGALCLKKRDPSLFTAGLLCDIGRLLLSDAVPGLYRSIDKSLYGSALLSAENSALGFPHPEAGHSAAIRWQLPPEICVCIRYHHFPQNYNGAKKNVWIVSLASAMAEARRAKVVIDTSLFYKRRDALEAIELDAQDLLSVHMETEAEMNA